MIYVCPNCINFLPKKVHFITFWGGWRGEVGGSHRPCAFGHNGKMNTHLSLNVSWFRTFQNRNGAYSRAWWQGCAILLRRSWHLCQTHHTVLLPTCSFSIPCTWNLPFQLSKFQLKCTDFKDRRLHEEALNQKFAEMWKGLMILSESAKGRLGKFRF